MLRNSKIKAEKYVHNQQIRSNAWFWGMMKWKAADFFEF
jgi:hypothetical protein